MALRPRAPIVARYGAGLFARLDALLGSARSAINPQFPAPAYVAERRFASPLTQMSDIEGVILALARELARLLARHHEGARRLCLSLFRLDGRVRDVFVGSSRVLADAAAIASLFREKLHVESEEWLETDEGFETLRLAALVIEPLEARQDRLSSLAGEARAAEEDLAALIDRLGARLGVRRVTRLMAQDTHIPEFAVTPLPAAFALAKRVEAGWGVAARQGTQDAAAKQGVPVRPLRLFARPEPIEAMASVPDGPPLRFRWRRMLHEVAAIEGPERIAPEWWKADAAALTRDYFRAEDTEGRRFWLYREGLYSRETVRPRWFMHGLFA